jgi:hypothetical protein
MSKVKEMLSPGDYIIDERIELHSDISSEEIREEAYKIFNRDYKSVQVNAKCPECGDFVDELYEEPGNLKTFNQFSCEECIVEGILEDLITD